MQESRTPDFKGTSLPDGFFFFCEVKSLETKIGSNGILHTRVFNIFTATIHDAFGQFQAVNSQHIVPNVIAYVTHNFQIDWKSFEDFLQGYIDIPEFAGRASAISLKRVSNSPLDMNSKKLTFLSSFKVVSQISSSMVMKTISSRS